MKPNTGKISVPSLAFGQHSRIPKKYASDGENITPPLQVRDVPAGTTELVLICHDPDEPFAHGFTHWVVRGISPDTKEIAEGIGSGGKFIEGMNSLGKKGYSGPAPPKGHGLHHYYFWVYALNGPFPNIAGELTRENLLNAIQNSIIEQARLVGLYEM